mmetsp:Transcript_66777/g.168594  ORF Transcript_66777/g.168594 Transcript_66777/m.168594 type:complete len:138 (+) Transcript_66777:572-985(+)
MLGPGPRGLQRTLVPGPRGPRRMPATGFPERRLTRLCGQKAPWKMLASGLLVLQTTPAIGSGQPVSTRAASSRTFSEPPRGSFGNVAAHGLLRRLACLSRCSHRRQMAVAADVVDLSKRHRRPERVYYNLNARSIAV